MAGQEEDNYDDIIKCPHYVSKIHPHMTMKQRASQFSPFMPLNGYNDAVKETARLTDTKIELGEDLKELLNQKLRMLHNQAEQYPKVKITYFQPDIRKEGGVYVTSTGCVEKVDVCERIVYMEDGTKIPIEEITEVEGKIFSAMEGYAN